MNLISTLRTLDDGRGAVRVDDLFDTDPADLWQAVTDPDRLSRWIADVSGELRPGGRFRATFTSGWEGSGSVDTCEPTSRLVVTTWEDETPDEPGTIEVTLTPEGARTRLTIEERGLPADNLPPYGAGWQIHAEDLRAHLEGRSRDTDVRGRFEQLIPAYRQG